MTTPFEVVWNRVKVYIPFLQELISIYKNDFHPNRQQQLPKIIKTYNLLTNQRLKYETLCKCEKVIIKLYELNTSKNAGESTTSTGAETATKRQSDGDTLASTGDPDTQTTSQVLLERGTPVHSDNSIGQYSPSELSTSSQSGSPVVSAESDTDGLADLNSILEPLCPETDSDEFWDGPQPKENRSIASKPLFSLEEIKILIMNQLKPAGTNSSSHNILSKTIEDKQKVFQEPTFDRNARNPSPPCEDFQQVQSWNVPHSSTYPPKISASRFYDDCMDISPAYYSPSENRAVEFSTVNMKDARVRKAVDSSKHVHSPQSLRPVAVKAYAKSDKSFSPPPSMKKTTVETKSEDDVILQPLRDSTNPDYKTQLLAMLNKMVNEKKLKKIQEIIECPIDKYIANLSNVMPTEPTVVENPESVADERRGLTSPTSIRSTNEVDENENAVTPKSLVMVTKGKRNWSRSDSRGVREKAQPDELPKKINSSMQSNTQNRKERNKKRNQLNSEVSEENPVRENEEEAYSNEEMALVQAVSRMKRRESTLAISGNDSQRVSSLSNNDPQLKQPVRSQNQEVSERSLGPSTGQNKSNPCDNSQFSNVSKRKLPEPPKLSKERTTHEKNLQETVYFVAVNQLLQKPEIVVKRYRTRSVSRGRPPVLKQLNDAAQEPNQAPQNRRRGRPRKQVITESTAVTPIKPVMSRSRSDSALWTEIHMPKSPNNAGSRTNESAEVLRKLNVTAEEPEQASQTGRRGRPRKRTITESTKVALIKPFMTCRSDCVL